MSSTSRSRRLSDPELRVSGPTELLEAIPYLLGFHPSESLVLVGLRAGCLVAVTARLDLSDVVPGAIGQTLDAFRTSDVADVVAAVYTASDVDPDPPLPFAAAVELVQHEAGVRDVVVLDAVLVRGGRWWSYLCGTPGCCPGDGTPLPEGTSPVAAAATYAGLVALPDRAAVEAQLAPAPDADRQTLQPLIEAEEHAAVRAALRDAAGRHARVLKREIFAAARSCNSERPPRLPDEQVARFGAALADIDIRDALWFAIDGGRLAARPLCAELARRLPAPYDATPLLLYGWAAWREGDGALARIAAERASRSDPDCTAVGLLVTAVSRGLDPTRVPRLRRPRSA